jgi:hypothetical protein
VNREFAIDRLRALWRTPTLWAATREAFAAQVALLLELLDVDPRVLVQKAFKVPHTCAADRDKLTAPVDDDWARAFVDEAAKLAGLELKRTEQELNQAGHSSICRLLDSPARRRGMPFVCTCGVQTS